MVEALGLQYVCGTPVISTAFSLIGTETHRGVWNVKRNQSMDMGMTMKVFSHTETGWGKVGAGQKINCLVCHSLPTSPTWGAKVLHGCRPPPPPICIHLRGTSFHARWISSDTKCSFQTPSAATQVSDDNTRKIRTNCLVGGNHTECLCKHKFGNLLLPSISL